MTGALVETPTERATLAGVRGAIARGWIGESIGAAASGERVGEVVLAAHQAASAARVRRALREGGGVVLADAVGSGKTYVALAVAAAYERVLVVGPAVLGSMWAAAAARCGVRMRWVSYEALSRGAVVSGGAADLVVVDEGHHVRTPGTRRYGALASLCERARVLVLSATPVHNRVADVRALVALWRGASAFEASDAELACWVVRGEADVGVRIPVVSDPVWVPVGDDVAVLEALLAVPSPLGPSDGGGAEWLVTIGMVRQWASSEGALRAALGRRLGQCVALESALSAGRYPSRRELRGWLYADGAVQLAFPELTATGAASGELGALLAAVRSHAAGLRIVRELLDGRPSVDGERAARLVEIVRRHDGKRVVAFAQYGATVEALYRRVASRTRAAVLTGRGGRVAGGEVSRAELLRRFAPRANGGDEGREAERVELLLTTDLLSEGVNLQDSSVVVHLDLPWTAARLAQRVGRAARMGSLAERVSVYALRPPAAAERWVGIEGRLRAKAESAARSVGAVGLVLPGVGGRASASEVEALGAIDRVLRGWAAVGGADGGVVELRGVGRRGFLALVRRGRRADLLASDGGAPDASPAAVLSAVRAVDRAEAADDAATGATEAMRAAVARWAQAEGVALAVGLRGSATAAVRRRVLERIARVVRRAPRHVRSEVLGLAAAARRAAVAGYGVGAERVLAELEGAALEDRAWLRAVGAFGLLHARSDGGAESGRGAVRVLAAVVFAP